MLKEYLKLRKKIELKEEALFINSRDWKRISVRNIEKILKKYLRASGLSMEITPHSLRHTFATLMIENGGNIKVVSQLLGHSDINTTLNMYTHLSSEHVRRVFKLCHPMSKKKLPLKEVIENRLKTAIHY